MTLQGFATHCRLVPPWAAWMMHNLSSLPSKLHVSDCRGLKSAALTLAWPFLLAACMMLRHINLNEHADNIQVSSRSACYPLETDATLRQTRHFSSVMLRKPVPRMRPLAAMRMSMSNQGKIHLARHPLAQNPGKIGDCGLRRTRCWASLRRASTAQATWAARPRRQSSRGPSSTRCPSCREPGVCTLFVKISLSGSRRVRVLQTQTQTLQSAGERRQPHCKGRCRSSAGCATVQHLWKPWKPCSGGKVHSWTDHSVLPVCNAHNSRDHRWAS